MERGRPCVPLLPLRVPVEGEPLHVSQPKNIARLQYRIGECLDLRRRVARRHVLPERAEA